MSDQELEAEGVFRSGRRMYHHSWLCAHCFSLLSLSTECVTGCRLLAIDDLLLCWFVAFGQALTSSGGGGSGYTCAGAAGTLYVANGTSFLLIFDNANENSASSTRTPFPGDLNGVQLTQLNISRKAYVDLRQTQSNNDVRSYGFDLDANSKVTGDSVVIDTSNASVRGSITGSTTVWFHNAQSGVGTVTVHSGSSIACSS